MIKAFKVGDIVTCISPAGNAVGEGVLWVVYKSDKTWAWIEPVYTVTGTSSLRKKKVNRSAITLFTLSDMGNAIRELRDLAVQHFNRSAGLEEGPQK